MLCWDVHPSHIFTAALDPMDRANGEMSEEEAPEVAGMHSRSFHHPKIVVIRLLQTPDFVSAVARDVVCPSPKIRARSIVPTQRPPAFIEKPGDQGCDPKNAPPILNLPSERSVEPFSIRGASSSAPKSARFLSSCRGAL